MPAIKRYDFYTKETLAENNGAWVRYSDHQATLAALEKERDRARKETQDAADIASACARALVDVGMERDRLRAALSHIADDALLGFIAAGACRCDPDVGASPCEKCAADDLIRHTRATLSATTDPQPTKETK